MISAIAIATTDKSVKTPAHKEQSGFSWEALNKEVAEKMPKELLPEDSNARQSTNYEAETATVKGKFQKLEQSKREGVLFGEGRTNSISWDISTGLAQVYALRFKYMNNTGRPLKVRMQLIDSKGGVLKDDELTFAETPAKWRTLSTSTGGFINAGYYKIVLWAEDMAGLSFDALEVQ